MLLYKILYKHLGFGPKFTENYMESNPQSTCLKWICLFCRVADPGENGPNPDSTLKKTQKKQDPDPTLEKQPASQLINSPLTFSVDQKSQRDINSNTLL